jgi:hypothetical protein
MPSRKSAMAEGESQIVLIAASYEGIVTEREGGEKAGRRLPGIGQRPNIRLKSKVSAAGFFRHTLLLFQVSLSRSRLMQRFVHTLFCGLMVGMLGYQARAADEGQPAKEELPRFQGTWQLVYAETDGKTTPGERVRSVRVEVKGNSHSVYI